MNNPCLKCKMLNAEKAACCGCPERLEWEDRGKPSMKISKDTCDKEFAEKKLELSESKCKECEYFYLCPYILKSYNDVVYGD